MSDKSFIFYESWFHALQGISDKLVRLEVYEAIAGYALTGDIPPLSPMAEFGFNLCKGAPNPEGFATYVMVQKYCSESEEINQIGYDQLAENYKWTEDMIEMRKTLYQMAAEHPVFDFQNGVSPDIKSTMQDVSQASMISGGNQITWTECRETYEKGLQYYIDKENKNIVTDPTAES